MAAAVNICKYVKRAVVCLSLDKDNFKKCECKHSWKKYNT